MAAVRAVKGGKEPHVICREGHQNETSGCGNAQPALHVSLPVLWWDRTAPNRHNEYETSLQTAPQTDRNSIFLLSPFSPIYILSTEECIAFKSVYSQSSLATRESGLVPGLTITMPDELWQAETKDSKTYDCMRFVVCSGLPTFPPTAPHEILPG